MRRSNRGGDAWFVQSPIPQPRQIAAKASGDYEAEEGTESQAAADSGCASARVMLLWEMQGWAAIALNAQPRNSINRYPEKKGEKGEKKGDRYNSIAPSSDGSMTSSRKCVPVPIFPTFFLAIFPPCAARGAATDLGGIVHSIEGIVLGEMADELLLASTRVVPNVLQESGYEFHFPELEPALRYLLGR